MQLKSRFYRGWFRPDSSAVGMGLNRLDLKVIGFGGYRYHGVAGDKYRPPEFMFLSPGVLIIAGDVNYH